MAALILQYKSTIKQVITSQSNQHPPVFKKIMEKINGKEIDE